MFESEEGSGYKFQNACSQKRRRCTGTRVQYLSRPMSPVVQKVSSMRVEMTVMPEVISGWH